MRLTSTERGLPDLLPWLGSGNERGNRLPFRVGKVTRIDLRCHAGNALRIERETLSSERLSRFGILFSHSSQKVFKKGYSTQELPADTLSEPCASSKVRRASVAQQVYPSDVNDEEWALLAP
jgi:hypothetical protein